MRNLLTLALLAPIAAHAHPAPFAHTHGLLDDWDHPLAVITLLVVIAVVTWITLRGRR
ncbi:MAG TPA: hypothetical protein VFB36_12950 [Nevskiaceae bacterium]|nr:hypothetical protein [Nevskiaceae bacterium]